jgi:uncharacterized protein (TIGR02246 family)
VREVRGLFEPIAKLMVRLLLLSKISIFGLFRWLAIGIILLGLMSNMDANASQNLPPQDIRSTIDRARSAWIERDADALARLFTLDAELIVPGQRWQGRAKIREEIAKFSRQYEQVEITIHRIVLDGNLAAIEWHYEDTEKSTGKRNRSDDAILIECRDGLISYWREYFDPNGT